MGVPGQGVITAVAMGFMLLLAAINLRGVGNSVEFNVVLTLVEMTALCIVTGVGFYVLAQGTGNAGEIFVFNDYQDKGLFVAGLTSRSTGSVCFLAGPWVGRNVIQHQIAGGLMAIGVALWFVTWLINRRTNTGTAPRRRLAGREIPGVTRAGRSIRRPISGEVPLRP